MIDLDEEGVVNLCEAILNNTSKEYRSLWKAREKGTYLEREVNRARRKEIENFIRSPWFDLVSFGVSDADTIIERLRD